MSKPVKKSEKEAEIKSEKPVKEPQPDYRDFGERYNACFTDFVVKTGAGGLLGSMVGGFFMRNARKWPLFIGGGVGFGLAYANCENSLNGYLQSLDPKACKVKKLA